MSTDVISHKLPINSGFDPVKQKTQKFKRELSLKIKADITKQIKSPFVEVTQYPTWLANVVPVAKKYRGIRIYVNYRDLNKAIQRIILCCRIFIFLLTAMLGTRSSHLWIVTHAITKF